MCSCTPCRVPVLLTLGWVFPCLLSKFLRSWEWGQRDACCIASLVCVKFFSSVIDAVFIHPQFEDYIHAMQVVSIFFFLKYQYSKIIKTYHIHESFLPEYRCRWYYYYYYYYYTHPLSFLLKPSDMAEWGNRGQDKGTASSRTVFALWEPSLFVYEISENGTNLKFLVSGAFKVGANHTAFHIALTCVQGIVCLKVKLDSVNCFPEQEMSCFAIGKCPLETDFLN